MIDFEDFMNHLRDYRLVIAHQCYKMQRSTLAPKDWNELSGHEKKKAIYDADKIIGAINAADRRRA